MERFLDRQVLVTGAGKDIGRAAARRFAAEGAEVTLIGRRREPLDETAALIAEDGGRAHVALGDVTSTADVARIAGDVVSRSGRIDVVINNAGDRDPTPFVEVTEQRWDEVIATNLKGPFLLSQAAAKVMIGAGKGVILHTASIDSRGGDGTFASYSTSKAGLLGLMRTMAIELAPSGIRVNCVSPGYTDSSNLGDFVGAEVRAYLNGSFDRVPMRRMVRPEEIAAAFCFLAADEASGITGTDLVVDCGLSSNLYVLETMPDAVGTPAA